MTSWLFFKTYIGLVHGSLIVFNLGNLYQNYVAAGMYIPITANELAPSMVANVKYMWTQSNMHTLQVLNVGMSTIRISWIASNYSNVVNNTLVMVPQLGYILIYVMLIVHWENTIRIIKHKPPLDSVVLRYIYGTLGLTFAVTILMATFELTLLVKFVFIVMMVLLMMCGVYDSFVLLYHYDNFKTIVQESQVMKTIDRIMMDVKCLQSSYDAMSLSSSSGDSLHELNALGNAMHSDGPPEQLGHATDIDTKVDKSYRATATTEPATTEPVTTDTVTTDTTTTEIAVNLSTSHHDDTSVDSPNSCNSIPTLTNPVNEWASLKTRNMQTIQRTLTRLSDKLSIFSDSTRALKPALTNPSTSSSIATYKTILRTIYHLSFITISSTVMVVFTILVIMMNIALDVQPDTYQHYLYMVGIHVIQECTIASIITFATFVSTNHVEL